MPDVVALPLSSVWEMVKVTVGAAAAEASSASRPGMVGSSPLGLWKRLHQGPAFLLLRCIEWM